MHDAPEADVADIAELEPRRPGRPRSSEADRAILDAALAEYAAGGIDGLTVDNVAARAGVSKATVYRRYPCKSDLVIAAAQQCADERLPRTDTGDIKRDLRVALGELQAMMIDPVVGAALRMLIGDAPRDEKLLSMHRDFAAARRAGTIRLLEAAVGRGQLRADIDLHTAADVLVGPLFMRFLVTSEPIGDAYLDTLVDDFVRAYGSPQTIATR
jgi:AcrR family transcriptional regulator